jgi:hypothetical protein
VLFIASAGLFTIAWEPEKPVQSHLGWRILPNPSVGLD